MTIEPYISTIRSIILPQAMVGGLLILFAGCGGSTQPADPLEKLGGYKYGESPKVYNLAVSVANSKNGELKAKTDIECEANLEISANSELPTLIRARLIRDGKQLEQIDLQRIGSESNSPIAFTGKFKGPSKPGEYVVKVVAIDVVVNENKNKKVQWVEKGFSDVNLKIF